MKKALIFFTVMSAVSVMEGQNVRKTVLDIINPRPFVIPEVREWKGDEGTVVPRRIIVKDRVMKEAAEALSRDYFLLKGRRLPVTTGKSGQGDIVFLQKDDTGGEEGYRIILDGRRISIEAATRKGAYWATRTLLQMSERQEQLPCGRITDAPRYALRGLMIDCGRKFIPIDYLRDLLKVMAYYKMNALQLHLNDNAFPIFFANDWNSTQSAFRIECATYPGLTASDGSYTKEQFIELQKYADSLGVEIIPEIDVPAHSLAFTRYRPSLAAMDLGVDHLDLTDNSVIPFVDSLFTEYIGGKNPVFRSRRVHIGGGEYSHDRQDATERLHAFTDHLIRLVKSCGKEPVVWGTLTYGKDAAPAGADGVLMEIWHNGCVSPAEMNYMGCRMVSMPDSLVYIVPAAGYYNDYLDIKYLYESWTPAHICGVTLDEGDPRIEGGMFAEWNDHVGNGITVADIHHRIFPALQTMSAKCWSGGAVSTPWTLFDSRRSLLSEAPGVNRLASHGKEHSAALTVDTLRSDTTLGVSEIGYDYRVSFTIDCKHEEAGTILFSSPNAIFYLADPKQRRVGFSREGYLNTFNYLLPDSGRVDIAIEGTNKTTRLFVDGALREELSPIMVYAVLGGDTLSVNDSSVEWKPAVYKPSAKMMYLRTLIFPLKQAGHFNSRITNVAAVRK